jgi:hypothetical protein
VDDPLVAITRYMVIKKLAGDVIAIMAIKEYLVDGLSPSTIGHKYNISKFRVRGYVQRIMDKARNHIVAESIVKMIFPYILNIEPIVLKVRGRYICLKCDQQLTKARIEHHIRKKHKELVNQLVAQIVSNVKRRGESII